MSSLIIGKPKFTIGNWTFDKDHTVYMEDDEAIEICVMSPIDAKQGKWFHGEETIHNALLIESAPDMFNLLQQYNELLEALVRPNPNAIKLLKQYEKIQKKQKCLFKKFNE